MKITSRAAAVFAAAQLTACSQNSASRQVADATNGTPSIRTVQEKLNFLGYEPGPSNGRIAAKTIAALKQFQTDYGLDSTGTIDSRTSALLFVKSPEESTIGVQVVQLDHPLHAGDIVPAYGGNSGIQIPGAHVSSSGVTGVTILDSDAAVASRQFEESDVNSTARVREKLRNDPNYVSSRGEYGFTPLHEAAGDGRATVVRLLIAAKADVNAKSDVGRTPLFHALDNDHPIVVRVLLARGADINARDNKGLSPMHSVLKSHDYMREAGCLKLVTLLVAQEADVNAQDKQGRTPLDYAEEIGEEGRTIAAFLREHGAKPGQTGDASRRAVSQ